MKFNSCLYITLAVSMSQEDIVKEMITDIVYDFAGILALIGIFILSIFTVIVTVRKHKD